MTNTHLLHNVKVHLTMKLHEPGQITSVLNVTVSLKKMGDPNGEQYITR